MFGKVGRRQFWVFLADVGPFLDKEAEVRCQWLLRHTRGFLHLETILLLILLYPIYASNDNKTSIALKYLRTRAHDILNMDVHKSSPQQRTTEDLGWNCNVKKFDQSFFAEGSFSFIMNHCIAKSLTLTFDELPKNRIPIFFSLPC